MARKRAKSDGTPGNEQARFPPERIVRFLQQLRSALSLTEGRTINLEILEELTGRSAATIRSWCDGVRMQQLEFVFSLLERLPQRLRNDVIDQTCRVIPSLSHPKLAHDPLALSLLKELLEKRRGFTVIQGEPQHMGSFLMHALGNSYRATNAKPGSVTGLDIQAIPTWAAIPGMLRVSECESTPAGLRETWSKLRKAENGSLILLKGGTANRNPEFQSDILEIGTRCHVVITDMLVKTQDMARRLHLPFHVVTVAPAREQPEWIRVIVSGGMRESQQFPLMESQKRTPNVN